MKTLLVFAIVLFTVNASESITGRWETLQPDGNVLGLVFSTGNRFEGYINKKPFVSGTYSFHHNIITMNGNGCINMPGKYQIHFWANADSIRWEAIQDSCAARRKGLNNVVFKRIK